jgi:hypothetical protein
LNDFGSSVSFSPCTILKKTLAISLSVCRKAQIANLDVVTGIKQYVFGFNVAMTNSIRVHVIDCSQHLAKKLLSHVWSKAVELDVFKKLALFSVFKDNAVCLRFLVKVIDEGDVFKAFYVSNQIRML